MRIGPVPLVLGLLAWGCDAPPSSRAGGAGGSGGGPSAPEGECAVVDPSLTESNATELFTLATVPTFDLWLPPERWAELLVNARDEQYVEATACFEGRGLGRIGLRFKGAYGSLYSCFDASGNLVCKKLSLKLSFDEYEPEQRFHGLKRLNFHAHRYDESHLRERLAFDLHRAMGVIAPRTAWATVRVNGEVYGLFGMVEQVDGRFTADRWPERGDENLFKEVWPVHADAEDAVSGLETNEEAADVGAFVAFAEAMTGAEDAALRETLGRHVDLDYWARYMAVDDALAAYDGITTFYTAADGSWGGNHNFYLYQETPSRFTIVPWDLETTFTRSAGFGRVPHWTTTPADCAATYPVWNGADLALAPGCDPLFRALAQDLEPYRNAGRQLLDGPFAEQLMLDAIDAHATLIRDHVPGDPNGPPSTRWEAAVSFLKKEIPGLRGRFERLLSGEMSPPAEIQVTGATDFETLDDYSLTDGPWLGSNASTSVSVSINSQAPLAGMRDLLMRFEYVDEIEPWQQWTSYRIPVESGSFDARGLTGLRMWVRADRPRNLRFDLDSPLSSRALDGIRLGWDVPVTEQAVQVEVLLSALAIPVWATPEPADDPQEILRTLSALVFHPECAGRDASGQLGQGVTDAGFLEIDQIEFF